jgi:hypothetical protein
MTSHALATETVAFTHDEVEVREAPKSRFLAIAGSGALLGGIAGVAIAVPLAASHGLEVFIATAIDVAAGLALIGGLIGANIAGTD